MDVVFDADGSYDPTPMKRRMRQEDPGTNAGGAQPIIPAERIEQAILLIRGEKVMLDADLARLYRVETGALTRAVRRNLVRFPPDFMFQLTTEEYENLKCQFGISSRWGGRRRPPYAFSEQGVAMLSSVLRSPRAVAVNVEIMRAFVRLRKMLASHEDLEQFNFYRSGIRKMQNTRRHLVT